MKSKIFIFLVSILWLIILWTPVNKIYSTDIMIQIHWNSMYPTLKNGDIFRAKIVKSFKELKNQDLVIFKLFNSKNYFVKRLWIKPWDHFKLSYEDDILLVQINNNSLLKLKNYKNTSFYKMLKIWSKWTNNWVVKTLQCAVLWDNKKNSIDSLNFGFISCNRIKYKLLLF